MKREDSLQFVQERLRRRHASPLRRELQPWPRHRVIRRFALRLAGGRDHVFHHVDRSVPVRCASGTLWITHDGDPKDVVLWPQESYRAEREEAMHLFTLQPCIVEIEFEDETIPEY